MSYPIICFVYSPITYETYLSMKKISENGSIEVIPIFARNIKPSTNNTFLSNKILYWDQTELQRSKTWYNLNKFIKNLVMKYGGYVLAIPQSGIPYIRMLIESQYCQGYVYSLDGNAAFEQGNKPFSYWMRQLIYRYKFLVDDNVIEISNTLGVDPQEIVHLHQRGTRLFDFENEKYLGCYSFFEDAFPGFSPEIIIPEQSTYYPDLSQYSLVLVPALRKASAEKLSFLLQKADTKIKSHGENWLLKCHPDTELTDEEKLAKVLNVESYNKKFQWYPDVQSREPAFLNFKLYAINEVNSTIMFLRKMSKSNYSLY